VLRAIGPEAKDAVPAILRTLSHSELGVTPLETAATQGQLKPAELAEAIRKLPAVVVVTRIGKPAVGPLVRMFKDPNPYLRLAAIVAVGDIGPDAKDAIPLWAASRCRAATWSGANPCTPPSGVTCIDLRMNSAAASISQRLASHKSIRRCLSASRASSADAAAGPSVGSHSAAPSAAARLPLRTSRMAVAMVCSGAWA
jgi:hypothetical protein